MKRKEPKYRYNNVMLIDDNELDNFINEKMLEANMFSKKIYVNSSAKSALEFLNNMVTMNENETVTHPEVIFVDINMPIMDGFQFIDRYQKNFKGKMKNPKLVVLTSSVYSEDREKAKAISKDIIFLNKPLTQNMLKEI